MSEQKKDNGNGERGPSRFALVVRKAANLSPEKWTDERIGAIARTVAPEGTNDAELAMFLSVCDRYQLDPFLKEIWLAKDPKSKKLMILTGRDSFLTVAEREPRYLGMESGLVHEQDEFVVEHVDGDVELVHRITGFERGELVGAFCLVRMEGRTPVLVTRLLSDYAHLHGKDNWRMYPKDMLQARVITAAHRLAVRISGLYTPDEMADAEFEDGSTSVEGKAVEDGSKRTLETLKAEIEGKRKARQERSAGERGRDIQAEVEQDHPFDENVVEAEIGPDDEDVPEPAPVAADDDGTLPV